MKTNESSRGSFFARVYEIVKQIPKGKVATYGQVAALAGNARMARQVGWALHSNPSPGEIPCHRVVNRFGSCSESFAFGGSEIQKELLINEGLEFSLEGNINLSIYRWQPVENIFCGKN
jgi:methylated-DNA-protein-cysteine methyltransferase-like protein